MCSPPYLLTPLPRWGEGNRSLSSGARLAPSTDMMLAIELQNESWFQTVNLLYRSRIRILKLNPASCILELKWPRQGFEVLLND